jgi:hypothetical protein
MAPVTLCQKRLDIHDVDVSKVRVLAHNFSVCHLKCWDKFNRKHYSWTQTLIYLSFSFFNSCYSLSVITYWQPHLSIRHTEIISGFVLAGHIKTQQQKATFYKIIYLTHLISSQFYVIPAPLCHIQLGA